MSPAKARTLYTVLPAKNAVYNLWVKQKDYSLIDFKATFTKYLGPTKTTMLENISANKISGEFELQMWKYIQQISYFPESRRAQKLQDKIAKKLDP